MLDYSNDHFLAVTFRDVEARLSANYVGVDSVFLARRAIGAVFLGGVMGDVCALFKTAAMLIIFHSEVMQGWVGVKGFTSFLDRVYRFLDVFETVVGAVRRGVLGDRAAINHFGVVFGNYG